jgi:hypothetical protein
MAKPFGVVAFFALTSDNQAVMGSFDDIKPGARLRGLDAAGTAEIVQVTRFGEDALNLVFRVNGRVGERLVYRGEEAGFEFLDAGRAYAFDADGSLLRLASEAYRVTAVWTPPCARAD